MSSSTALSVTDLRKTYANGLKALDGVSLDVERGEFFALLGPNGAGKSTLIGIVCSLVNRDSGGVSVFGEDLTENPGAVKSRIGLVPQEFNFNMWETPWAILLNQAGYYGIDRSTAKPRAERFLRELGLWDKRHGRSRDLSGGMKRRLMIARALVHEPELLILDEPTAGVDIELRRSMWEFLREINESGTTIILTTHYLEEAESLGLARVMAFTYVPGFFEKLGFQVVEHASLPHKVFNDCLNCPKFHQCDEIAVLKELGPLDEDGRPPERGPLSLPQPGTPLPRIQRPQAP